MYVDVVGKEKEAKKAAKRAQKQTVDLKSVKLMDAKPSDKKRLASADSLMNEGIAIVAEKDRKNALARLWMWFEGKKRKDIVAEKKAQMKDMWADRAKQIIDNGDAVWDEAHREYEKREIIALYTPEAVWDEAHVENRKRTREALAKANALQETFKKPRNRQKQK